MPGRQGQAPLFLRTHYIPSFWGDLTEKLDAGILYDSYRYFGAHFCERKEVLGTEFMTFAPGAERVSVVGDFNGWDGRIHQMRMLEECGIFEIFIPGAKCGDNYKYEFHISLFILNIFPSYHCQNVFV